MNLSRCMAILRSIRAIRKTKTVGQGRLSHSQIAFWIGATSITTYRDLKKMETIGLVKKEVYKYKNVEAHSWFATDDGLELLSLQKELSLGQI